MEDEEDEEQEQAEPQQPQPPVVEVEVCVHIVDPSLSPPRSRGVQVFRCSLLAMSPDICHVSRHITSHCLSCNVPLCARLLSSSSSLSPIIRR